MKAQYFLETQREMYEYAKAHGQEDLHPTYVYTIPRLDGGTYELCNVEELTWGIEESQRDIKNMRMFLLYDSNPLVAAATAKTIAAQEVEIVAMQAALATKQDATKP